MRVFARARNIPSPTKFFLPCGKSSADTSNLNRNRSSRRNTATNFDDRTDMALTEALPTPAKPRVGRVADPCIMVIFGVTGDLTKRKLIPSLYNLASQGLLSREFAVVGVARNPLTNEEARAKLTEDFKQFASGPIDQDLWEWFVRHVYYAAGDFDDPATYDK